MSTLQELQTQRNDLADKIRDMAAGFKANGEKWKSTNDQKAWDALNDRYDGVMEAIGSERSGEVLTRAAAIEDLQNSPVNDFGPGRHSTNRGSSSASGPRFRNMATGKEIRALLPSEPVLNHLRNDAGFDDDPPVSPGNLIHSLLTGEPQGMNAAQFNAQIGGSDSAGGYILNPTLSGTIVDLARSASVAMQAGAVTLPMDSREMRIARLTQDPTAQWRAEGREVTASSMAFDAVTLSAKTLAAIVPVSLELVEDASNIGEIINNALQSALGLALDRAVLFGDGSAENPRGIRHTDGINTIAAVGTPSDYSEVSSAVSNILNANYTGQASGLSWVSHPRDGATYDGLTDTTGQPLQPTPWAAQLQRYATTSLPTDEGGGSNESVGIVGAFSQAMVGMRTSGVRIRVMDQGSVVDENDVTHNATSQLKRIIIAHLRADVVVLRPSWFSLMTGITNS